MAEFWATIAQQMSGGSRTDVLRALVWPNALLVLALTWGATHQMPFSIILLFSVLLVLFLFLYAAAYIFFGVKDPNLLRSEKFNIEKLQIEHGINGDSVKGIADERTTPKLISQQRPEVEKGK